MVPSSPAVEKQVPVEPGPDLKLRSWRCLVCYLCFYGFMAQIRPGESFITPYLLGPDKNFTRKQVTNEITPVLPYSYLAVLVPVFLLTDYLRYMPVLLLQGLSYVSVWLLLLGRSVAHMQLMELFYSVTMAVRIAYSSYIFLLVQPARYQRVAGYSRAAVLLGVFTSSMLGQLLVTAGGVSFSTLSYISLAFLTFSVVLALFLKRPKRSLFFNRGAAGREPSASASELDWGAACGGSVLARMLRELGDSLRRPQLRLWSLWWVFNSAGYYLVVYYVHILWNEVNPTTNSARLYNGAADAASTLLGAITSFAAGFVKIRWATLCLGLRVNTFFATIVKTVITFIVSGIRVLGLPVHQQFQLYSVYFLLLSIIYFLGAVLDGLRHCQRGRHQPLPLAQDLRSPAKEKAALALSMPDKDLRSLPPAQSPSLSPEDGLGAAGPGSGEQRQSDLAPAPQAAGFLSPVPAPSAYPLGPTQASGPEQTNTGTENQPPHVLTLGVKH
uniref:Solute carrier family 19 member 1 n=1 Tax=Aotus nancymaae TaxID=37293 RepID=A0A2K5DZ53_AOTNA